MHIFMCVCERVCVCIHIYIHIYTNIYDIYIHINIHDIPNRLSRSDGCTNSADAVKTEESEHAENSRGENQEKQHHFWLGRNSEKSQALVLCVLYYRRRSDRRRPRMTVLRTPAAILKQFKWAYKGDIEAYK
jgi:hypothetical protein